MIHLRTFNLERIDFDLHQGILYHLKRDRQVCNYISPDFLSFLEKYQADNDDTLEAGKAYVVLKNQQEVGVVGSFELSSCGFLEIWYIVKKSLRGRGYGERLLAEFTFYLIDHIDGIQDILLSIDPTNVASIKVALRNGYIEEESSSLGIKKYRYFAKKNT